MSKTPHNNCTDNTEQQQRASECPDVKNYK